MSIKLSNLNKLLIPYSKFFLGYINNIAEIEKDLAVSNLKCNTLTEGNVRK